MSVSRPIEVEVLKAWVTETKEQPAASKRSLRNVEDLLHKRGIEISRETGRFWWNRFGQMFAAEIRRKREDHLPAFSGWRWHVDEVFVKINGERHCLWRAVDHEGEVLVTVVTKR